ncbi:hypothetical protein EIP86_009717 [Pleurotus ostreatoroseus]|nr:hypothetical protein EIP86_009717 [Pleurotus ostreatoroseus]
MPFERYLHSALPRDPHAPHHEQQQQQQQHTYPDYSASAASADHYAFDSSIFSSNIQFQMPQVMLGPTVAPGGGAEVLPAGIVTHSNPLPPTWLAPRYADDFPLMGYDSQPFSQQLPMSSYYSSHPSQHFQDHRRAPSSSRHSSASFSVASSATPPSALSTLSASASPIASTPSVPIARQISLASSSSIPLPLAFSVPSASGLPIYSTSGFDLLSVLARVATRPNPKIALGPVDMTCSFAVVDTRRYDHPIVYASPTFYKLTGYSEEEIIGHNCRFLQSPHGDVQKGDVRHHTSPEAVAHLRKSLAADKECQISLVNYRKNGTPFINLVTVIPVPGGVHNTPEEADEVVYHVGFQVDLTEQPNAILQKLRDGTYMVNYSNNVAYPAPSASKDWKINSSAMLGTSKQFRALLNDPDFIKSIPLSISSTTLSLVTPDRNEKTDPYDGNRLLSLVLLECNSDFVVVLSLKGAFLYVAPSVRRVLGYEPDELAGKAVTDFCHAADTVPLMRELKESSTTALLLSEDGASSGVPKTVDLLFRMRAKSGAYIWVECRGRLHVEPGKGRKAIILSGRARSMPALQWGAVAGAGGLRPSLPASLAPSSHPTSPAGGASLPSPSAGAPGAAERACEQEFWALLSNAGSVLLASAAVRDVLGWGAGEVIGRAFGDFIGDAASRVVAEETLAYAYACAGGGAGAGASESRALTFEMRRKDGARVLVDAVYYCPRAEAGAGAHGAQRRPLVCQVKLHSAAASQSQALSHAPADEVFEELDVARGSSWQYELQQLKYANQRLLEEIGELEGALAQQAQERERESARMPYEHAWAGYAGLSMAQHQSQQPQQPRMPLKRSWEGTVVGGGGGEAT